MHCRERVTAVTTMSQNNTQQVSDTEVLAFYNLATSKILTGLEVILIQIYIYLDHVIYNNTHCYLGRSFKSSKWQ